MKVTSSSFAATLALAALLAVAPVAPLPAAFAAGPGAQAAQAERPAAAASALLVSVGRISPSAAILEELGESRASWDNMRAGIIDGIQNELAQNGIPVVRRDVAADLLKEQNLTFEGIVDPATAARAGRFTGARFVLYATVELNQANKFLGIESEYRTVIRYQVVDVQSGTAVRIDGAPGVAEGKQKVTLDRAIGGIFNSSDAWQSSPIGRSVQSAARQLTAHLTKLRPTTWAIRGIDGEDVVIEGGAQAGHTVGMKLEVCHVRDVAGFVKQTHVADAEVVAVQENRSLLRVTRLVRTDVPVQEDHIVRAATAPAAAPVAAGKAGVGR